LFWTGLPGFFHVATGRVEWQNWRVDSLVNISLDISSGQALIGALRDLSDRF
jgi:hypothetical protein